MMNDGRSFEETANGIVCRCGFKVEQPSGTGTMAYTFSAWTVLWIEHLAQCEASR